MSKFCELYGHDACDCLTECSAILKESTPSDHIADVGKMAGKTVFKINPQYIHINGEDHWIDTIVCSSPTSTPSTEQESQEDLMYDLLTDYKDMDYPTLGKACTELSKKFTITRKQ